MDAKESHFWATLEKIVKQSDINNTNNLNYYHQTQTPTTPTTTTSNTTSNTSSTYTNSNNSTIIPTNMSIIQQSSLKSDRILESNRNQLTIEEFSTMITSIKLGDYSNRVQSLENLVKSLDNVFVNEKFINILLKESYDLYDYKTPYECRSNAFKQIIYLIDRYKEKLDGCMVRNTFLNIIENFTKTNDDIDLRFTLFLLITKNGSSFKDFDFKILLNCLCVFVDNGHLLKRNKELFDLFNTISTINVRFIDQNLQNKLTQYILDYCIKCNNNLGKQQQNDEFKSCLSLIENLINHLTTASSVNNIVLSLCELTDTKNDKNEITNLISVFMHRLFTSSMSYCTLHAIVNEILSNKTIIHQHVIQGALIHIKQLIEDFKSNKIKNSKESKEFLLIKELYINIIICLPQIISLYDDSQFICLILSLCVDLINLAYYRDTYNTFLTFNSREYLIDVIEKCEDKLKNLGDDKLMKQYADLLNLIDKKDICTYKLNAQVQTPTQTQQSITSILQQHQPQQQQQQQQQSLKITLSKEYEDPTLLLKECGFSLLKDRFYKIVYKFDQISLINDSLINNCIEYFLQKKLLPCFDVKWLENTKLLIQKYYYNKSSTNVRKHCFELISKKMRDFDNVELKTYKEDLIKCVIIPICEYNLYTESDYEVKYYVILKLIEFAQMCQNECNVLLIVNIFDRVISNDTYLNDTNVGCIHKAINGLIDIFEYCLTPNFSESCIRIYNILVKYLDKYYTSYNVNNNNSNLKQLNNLTNNTSNNNVSPNSNQLFFNSNNNNNSSSSNNLQINKQQQNNLIDQQQQKADIFSINNSGGGGNSSNVYPSIVSPTNQLQRVSSLTNNLNEQQQQQQQQQNINLSSQIRRDIFDFLMRFRSDDRKRAYLIYRNDRKKMKLAKNCVLSMKELNFDAFDGEILFRKTINLLEICLQKESDWSVLNKVLQDLPSLLQNEMNLIQETELTNTIFNTVVLNKLSTKLESNEIAKFHPIVSSLILYHYKLEKLQQDTLLQFFVNGIRSKYSRSCLEALTVAIIEMHEASSLKCADIIVKLSQVSSNTIAQSVLELLSNTSELTKLLESSHFKDREFISVAAIAIKYTDPNKYSPYIILLAHYVICIWFLKCRGEIRVTYEGFVKKGLQNEVIMQLNKISPKDSKSPIKQNADDFSDTRKRLNTAEQASMKKMMENDDVKTKAPLSDNMKNYYKELVDVTLDFMSNHMYVNQNNDYYDICSNTPHGRKESLKEIVKKGQSRHWLVGNSIIKITTGLFTGICAEEPSILNTRQSHESQLSICSNSSTGSHNLNGFDDAIDEIDMIENLQNSSRTTASANNNIKPVNSNTKNTANNNNNNNSIGSSSKRRYKSGIESEYMSREGKLDHKNQSKDDSSLSSTLHGETISCNSRKSCQEASNEICKSNCWCNNLVEITVSYPTKVVTYLALIENQMHDIDTSIIEVDMNEMRKRIAIDIRQQVAQLPRISESSVYQDSVLTTPIIPIAIPKSASNNTQQEQQSKSVDSQFSTESSNRSDSESESYKGGGENHKNNKKIARKSSFDSYVNTKSSKSKQSSINTLDLSVSTRQRNYDNQNKPENHEHIQQQQQQQQQQPKQVQQSQNNKKLNANSFSTNIHQRISNTTQKSNQIQTCIEPKQVYAQLFQTTYENNQSLLIPEHSDVLNSVKILDYISCYLILKIGVIYIAPGQANDEKAILANCTGSTRYKHFLNGLGTLIKLKDMDSSKYYPGGLETDGSAGDFTYLWFDGITQVTFQVVTLIPNKDNNFKKKHIGNDHTIIVFNESGEDYQFSFIRGDVNCMCIEIEPLKNQTNLVKIKTNSEMSAHWQSHTDPKVISDNNLALVVRKMALHADLAARVVRGQKDGNLYGGKWFDRLRQINRIRKSCKEKLKEAASQQSASSLNFSLNVSSQNGGDYQQHDSNE